MATNQVVRCRQKLGSHAPGHCDTQPIEVVSYPSENKWFQTGPRPLCIGLILNELKERFLWGFTDNAFSGSTTHLTVPFWLPLPPQYLRKSMRQGPPLTDYLPF